MKVSVALNFLFIIGPLMLLSQLSRGESIQWVHLVSLNEGKFGVVKVPVLGCSGFAQATQLDQFTKEYLVNADMGCGTITNGQVNINYLTCAKLTESEVSQDNKSIAKISLNIANCDHKASRNFITMVRTAAALNFPQTQPKLRKAEKNRKPVQVEVTFEDNPL